MRKQEKTNDWVHLRNKFEEKAKNIKTKEKIEHQKHLRVPLSAFHSKKYD